MADHLRRVFFYEGSRNNIDALKIVRKCHAKKTDCLKPQLWLARLSPRKAVSAPFMISTEPPLLTSIPSVERAFNS